MALSDTHFPWVSQKTLDAFYRGIREFNPSHIVHLGDLFDMFSYGRFARSYNVCTPREEIRQGRDQAVRMWQKIRKLSPKSRCYQLRGNHDERPIKKVLNVAPEMEDFLSVDNLYQFDGVNTLATERDSLEIDGVWFMHGFKTKLGDHVRQTLKPTVVGHSHRGGLVPLRLQGITVFELNVGHAADSQAVPMGYTKMRQFSTWTTGFGLVEWVNKMPQGRFVAT